MKHLQILNRDELFHLEPNLNPGAIGALLCPDAGSVIPFEYAVALAENAVDNGVELRLRREVQSIEKDENGWVVMMRHWEPRSYLDPSMSNVPTNGSVLVSDMPVGGSDSCRFNDGVTVATEKIRCKCIVNAAGSGSGKKWKTSLIFSHLVVNSELIARMIGDESFHIKMRLGEYLLLDKNQGDLVTRTIFPCPGPLGKGVLVQKTLWGNLILGPTARGKVCLIACRFFLKKEVFF